MPPINSGPTIGKQIGMRKMQHLDRKKVQGKFESMNKTNQRVGEEYQKPKTAAKNEQDRLSKAYVPMNQGSRSKPEGRTTLGGRSDFSPEELKRRTSDKWTQPKTDRQGMLNLGPQFAWTPSQGDALERPMRSVRSGYEPEDPAKFPVTREVQAIVSDKRPPAQELMDQSTWVNRQGVEPDSGQGYMFRPKTEKEAQAISQRQARAKSRKAAEG